MLPGTVLSALQMLTNIIFLTPYDVGTIIFFLLQMRKLQQKEVK